MHLADVLAAVQELEGVDRLVDAVADFDDLRRRLTAQVEWEDTIGEVCAAANARYEQVFNYCPG